MKAPLRCIILVVHQVGGARGMRGLKSIGTYWRESAPRRRMPAGAKAGLTLVAVACLSIGTLSYHAFGPRDVIANQAA